MHIKNKITQIFCIYWNARVKIIDNIVHVGYFLCLEVKFFDNTKTSKLDRLLLAKIILYIYSGYIILECRPASFIHFIYRKI